MMLATTGFAVQAESGLAEDFGLAANRKGSRKQSKEKKWAQELKLKQTEEELVTKKDSEGELALSPD